MKLTLEIPNNHIDFFLQLVKSLNFKINILSEDTEVMPEWHKTVLEERLDKYQREGIGETVAWEDLKAKIEATL